MKVTQCIVCGSKEQTFDWVLHRLILRLTEKSLLWENCCSSRCYERLLIAILSKEVSIITKNGVAYLQPKQEKKEAKDEGK